MRNNLLTLLAIVLTGAVNSLRESPEGGEEAPLPKVNPIVEPSGKGATEALSNIDSEFLFAMKALGDTSSDANDRDLDDFGLVDHSRTALEDKLDRVASDVKSIENVIHRNEHCGGKVTKSKDPVAWGKMERINAKEEVDQEERKGHSKTAEKELEKEEEDEAEDLLEKIKDREDATKEIEEKLLTKADKEAMKEVSNKLSAAIERREEDALESNIENDLKEDSGGRLLRQERYDKNLAKKALLGNQMNAYDHATQNELERSEAVKNEGKHSEAQRHKLIQEERLKRKVVELEEELKRNGVQCGRCFLRKVQPHRFPDLPLLPIKEEDAEKLQPEFEDHPRKHVEKNEDGIKPAEHSNDAKAMTMSQWLYFGLGFPLGIIAIALALYVFV